MLRLKRHPTDTVSLALRERTGPSKRLVGKAFTYSILIHACMCLVFQIRTTFFESHTPAMTPTVFLDHEEGSIAILSSHETPSDYDPRQRIAQQMHLSPAALTAMMSAVSPEQTGLLSAAEGSCSVDTKFLPIRALPWSLSDAFSPSKQIHRAYPIKLSLHDDLRTLIMTNDGSEQFCEASFDSIFASPAFSESQPKVEFRIDVSAATGQIVLSTCLRELCDKRLQTVAQRLVQSIQFAPVPKAPKETISGVLGIQFAGTFETIEPLLEQERVA